MEASAREGCSLSPLLYALASDSLLRILRCRLPDATTRAVADGTAAVPTDWSSQTSNIFQTFACCEVVAKSSLHIAKTKSLSGKLTSRNFKCVLWRIRPRHKYYGQGMAHTSASTWGQGVNPFRGLSRWQNYMFYYMTGIGMHEAFPSPLKFKLCLSRLRANARCSAVHPSRRLRRTRVRGDPEVGLWTRDVVPGHGFGALEAVDRRTTNDAKCSAPAGLSLGLLTHGGGFD
jgi:hypothetical protein